MNDIAAALERRFGDPVRVAVGPVLPRDDDLFEAERAFVSNAVDKRRFEHAAGRRLARSLLGADVAIPSSPERAPEWPAGMSGSIAHSRTLAVVAVAPIVVGLGVDVEPDVPLSTDAGKVVLRPEEPTDGHLGKRIFCAKEAFYKAQWPHTRLGLGFADVTVQLDGDRFVVEPVVDVPDEIAGPHEGFFVFAMAHVFAGIRLTRL